MQFKKSPLLAIVLSVIGIFVSVLAFIMIQVAAKVDESSTGPSPLAIIELVLFVLLLAALSAKRPIFTKVVCIVAISALLVQAFIVSIVTSVTFKNRTVAWDSVTFLSLGVLCLVATILFFIYYLIGRKDTLRKMAIIMNLFVLGFYGAFAVVMIVSSFVGVYAPTRFSGLEFAILLANVALMSGILLSLQGNLESSAE